MNYRRLSYVVVAVAIFGACSTSSHRIDRSLSAVLPTASSFPTTLPGMPSTIQAVEKVGPTSASSAFNELALTTRPGSVGTRTLNVYDSPNTSSHAPEAPDYNVVMLLYQQQTPMKSVAFWDAHPPEVAQRSWAPNLVDDPAFARANLAKWFIESIGQGTPYRWKTLCLASGIRVPSAGCLSFDSWVQFCNWNLEVIVDTKRAIPFESSTIAGIMESLASTTAKQVSCANGH